MSECRKLGKLVKKMLKTEDLKDFKMVDEQDYYCLLEQHYNEVQAMYQRRYPKKKRLIKDIKEEKDAD